MNKSKTKRWLEGHRRVYETSLLKGRTGRFASAPRAESTLTLKTPLFGGGPFEILYDDGPYNPNDVITW